MSQPDPSSRFDGEPLPPESLAILAKARRSFGLSIGLLLLGFIAIAVALVYRATRSEAQPGPDYALAALKMPAGAEIVSAVAADGRVSVTYRIGSATSLRMFDGRTGEILGEIPIVTE